MESSVKFMNSMVECSLLDKDLGRPFRTGARRETTPVWDKDICIRCGMCYVFCPDGAIYRTEDGYFEANTDKCKGCGICHRECWFGVISMVKED